MSLDVYLTCPCCGSELYSSNITHNLGQMARAALVYQALWRPEELSNDPELQQENITANSLISTLETGLAVLKSDEHRFRAFDAPNGWGRYEHLVAFVEQYLAACRANPTAIVRVSR